MDDVTICIKFGILKYLSTMNLLQEITNCIEKFEQTKIENKIIILNTFYCPIKINLNNLSQIFEFGAHILIWHPEIFQNNLKEIIHRIIEDTLQTKIYFEQISSPIIIESSIITPTPSLGLSTFKAILISYKPKQKFIYSSNWKCNLSCCEEKSSIIFKYLPETPPKCPDCMSTLNEVPNARYEQEFTTGTIILSETLQGYKHNYFSQPTQKFHAEKAQYHNITKFELGKEYLITCVAKGDILKILGLKQINYHKIDYPIPNSKLQTLWERLQNNPWAFAQILSNTICAEAYPAGAFKHLRMGLLLSLASIKSVTPVHVLAIATEYDVALNLMLRATRLAQRLTKINSQTKLLGALFENNTYHAGPLVAAQEGICFLGNWFSYKNGKRGRIIKEAVDTRKIPVIGVAAESIPLKCAVWALAERPCKRAEIIELTTLIKVFGFAWTVEIEDDSSDDVINALLNQKAAAQIFSISDEEIIKFLQYVNSLNVEVAEEALDLIQNYFVCVRRARGENLPMTSLEPLIAIAKAHARINQRALALEQDVLVAIQLCEVSLGASPLYPAPPKDLCEFQSWLKEHILSLGSTRGSQISF